MRAILFGYDAPKPVIVDYLLVGGGGTTSFYCGGGGAGGLIYCCNELLGRKTYNVRVGLGGECNNACCGSGCSGGDSCFGKLVAYGGGGGGGFKGPQYNGMCGGSGGGGGYTDCVAGGYGLGCEGQGHDGATGRSCAGGGGGGAGCSGEQGNNKYNGGNGGDGLEFDISGECCYYAGGGGGRTKMSSPYTNGCDGLGAGYCGGGTGKDGVFILRYPSDCGYDICGGCKYECNGYCIHCFTSNGTLVVS